MTREDCGHHENKRKQLLRQIGLSCIFPFIIILLLTVLITWAVLRPTKPDFILRDATLYNINLKNPAQLNSLFQVTIVSSNPNDRIGIYYENMITYATYENQRITFGTSIPSTYQDTKGWIVWAPYLHGVSLPIAPYLGSATTRDLVTGRVQLVIKVDGRVRFKVGTCVSGSYQIHVNCDALILIGDTNSGVFVSSNNVIKYTLVTRCDVNV